jgi:hypothetical protein
MLLRIASEVDPDFVEPDEGQRLRVVLDQGEHPYLAVRAGAVAYLLDHKQRLWRLDQRSGPHGVAGVHRERHGAAHGHRAFRASAQLNPRRRLSLAW